MYAGIVSISYQFLLRWCRLLFLLLRFCFRLLLGVRLLLRLRLPLFDDMLRQGFVRLAFSEVLLGGGEGAQGVADEGLVGIVRQFVVRHADVLLNVLEQLLLQVVARLLVLLLVYALELVIEFLDAFEVPVRDDDGGRLRRLYVWVTV